MRDLSKNWEMRTVIRNVTVMMGSDEVPQGSEVVLSMFAIYINDIRRSKQL